MTYSPTRLLGEKRFSSEDTIRFAALSGDRNPMHVDPVFARRTQFGRQVVHGMHTLLWGLDQFFAGVGAPRPTSLKVRFAKPAFIGDTVQLRVADSVENERRLEITASDVALVTLSLVFGGKSAVFGGSSGVPDLQISDGHAPSQSPRELGLADINGMVGSISLAVGTVEAGGSFPAATRALGGGVVSALVATSRVVGMECPGMHSIFAGLSVDFVEPSRPTASLRWRVTRVDTRIRRVDLEISGGGIVGRLDTFLRMPPTRQLAMSEICKAVDSDEFAGECALIIGGSRGLGEVTAKIIAAGGGVPVITYAVGREEAVELAAEISGAGRKCHIMPYDVRSSAAQQLAALPAEPTAFYYFATCSIFRRKLAFYEPALMREFTAFFVDGFYDLCSELHARRKGKLAGFYPSTVAIDSQPRELTEYCLAKLAGEALCASLRSCLPDLDIVVARLPRIQTDQTATVVPVRSEPPLDIMLPIVRKVRAAATAPQKQEPVSASG